MSVLRKLLFGLFFASAVWAQSQTDVLAEMARLEASGRYLEAEEVAAKALGGKSVDDHDPVSFAAERLSRLRREYALSREKLIAQLVDALAGFTPEEFDRFDQDGRFDKRTIDGKVGYAGASRSNLFFRYPELEKRRKTRRDGGFAKLLTDHIERVREAAKDGGRYVLPEAWRATMTVTVEKDAVAAGKTVRCWLPLPRRLAHQSPGEIVEATPSAHAGGAEEPMRAAYFEQAARPGAPTEFKMSYRYETRAVAPFAKLGVAPPPLAAAERSRFLAEAPPHVVFTPEIVALAASFDRPGLSPSAKARAAYDWIGESIKYSYAIEYSTTPNISQATFERGWGDCGEAALLFITLCRKLGVPARWQSGWASWPGHETMHDWAEIWLDGEGWCPVDPYMAVFAKGCDAAAKTTIRDFYFGGLDHWRMIANSDHGVPLSPAKPSLRSDTVDFQRGEVECDGKNIYYDRFRYRLDFEKNVRP